MRFWCSSTLFLTGLLAWPGIAAAGDPAPAPNVSATPAPGAPYRYFQNGTWRVDTYGVQNCVWVPAHMRQGRWREGFWRRKRGRSMSLQSLMF